MISQKYQAPVYSKYKKHYDAAASLVTSQKMNKHSLRFDEHPNVVIDAD